MLRFIKISKRPHVFFRFAGLTLEQFRNLNLFGRKPKKSVYLKEAANELLVRAENTNFLP